MEENNFVPPSDAVVTKSKKSNFVPPTDAIVKKKVDSKPRSQEELWGSDSQPQDLYTSLATGAQEPQQVSDGLGGPPKMKTFTGLTPEEQQTLQAKPAEKKPVINKEIQEKIIKAEFKPKEYRDAGSRLIDKLATGSSQLGATLATIPEYGYELSVAPQKFIAEIFNIPSLNPDTEEFKKQADSRNAVKNYYQKEVSDLKEKSTQLDQQYSQGVYDSFINGDYTAGFEQLTNSFTESLPTTAAIMVGGAYAKAPQILAASTMLFGTEKSEQLRKENPELTANARIANSLASGFAQAITETIGSASIGSAAKALVAREGEKKSISILKDGLIDYYKSSLKKVPLTAAAVGEGVEEWSSQVAENAVDVATGVKPQDYNVFEGGSDALLGGVFGGIVFGAGLTGIKNTVNYQDRMKIKENNKNIFNLQSQLENQSITPEIKDEIDSKIEQLILENKKYVQDDVSKIESLPDDVKEKLVSSTNKIDELTSKAKEINSSDEITIETKAILLEGLKKEAVENVELKNSILNDTYVEDRAVEEVEIKPSEQKVTDVINRPATLESQAGVKLETPIDGDVYQEGQRVIFEDKNKKIYDLGNIDEISDKTVEELGIKPQEEIVSVTPEGKVKVGENEWNMQSDLPNYGIEYDNDGNVKAVSLKDDAGKTVMYEGQVAEDAAYQVLLKQTETPEQRQAINEILENDEELNRQLREAEEATQATAVEVTEPGAPKTQAEQYSEELDKTKESDPEAYWSVSPVSAEDAAKGTIIDTPDGAAIVKPDGDIAGLFKKATSKAKGVAQDLLKRAIAAGGKKLDNFDTYLTPQYIKAGFRVVSRVPFSLEYGVPAGYNKEKHGTPDVVAMVYDPEGKLDIEEKTFDDYDEAMAYRDSFLEPSIDTELEGLAKLFDESEKGFRESQVDNAKEALKGILPGVEFIVHETNEAYKKAVGDSSSGTYIMYSNGDKVIHINKQKANGRTVAHEVFHAVILDKIKGDKAVQEITARMVDAVYKTASPELRAELDAFAARYTDKTIRDEERLAELIGIIADGYPKMSPANKSIVKRWLEALAKMFRIKPFKDNEVIDLLNTLAGKISTGEVISENDIKAITEGASTYISVPTLIKRFQKTKEEKVEVGDHELSFVKKSDLIDMDSLMKDISDKKEKVWFWVADQLGRGNYSDKTIGKEHYLDAGPSFALDPINRDKNVIWATGKNENEINKLIGKSDYIFIISGSPIKSKLFNKSIIDIVAKRAGDFDTFKKDVLESSKIKSINEILSSINSWEELKNSVKRKDFLLAVQDQKEKNTPLKNTLEKYNSIVDLNELRDGFYADNNFDLNDIMLVLKPTGFGGKSNHSTYENDILGDVVGVPDIKVNAFDIMPTEVKDKYKELSKSMQQQVVAPYGIGVKTIQRSQLTEEKVLKDNPELKTTKVVDNNGNPLIVYHGTNEDNLKFRDADAFFSGNKEYASGYGKNLVKAYLDVKKLFVITEEQADAGVDPTPKGYDGFAIKYDDGTYDYRVKSASQIKIIEQQEIKRSQEVTKRLQQAKTIEEIVRIAKEAKYSDAAISAFLKAKGFSAEESTNAILGYNKKNIEARQKEEGIFTREGRNKVISSLSSFKRKFLSARSFLGKTTFIAKEGIEAGIKAQSKIASYLVSDLDNAIKKYDGDKEKIISDFDKFIRGEKVSLPDNFLEIGNAMRAHIDKLSYELINSGVVDQAENIKKNIGTYLTRSYEVFDKKDWAKMVDEETLQAARNFLKKQLLSEAMKEAKASGLDVDLILEKKVNQAITDLINREGAQSFVASGKTGSKDVSILKQKTDIPLEIRALMGEYTDPAQNYSRTIFKVASLINNAKFLKTVRNNGIGVYLFEKNDINRPKEFDTLIAAEGSETMNPLNGLYTTKEIAESLKESAGILNAIEVALPYSISGTVKSTYEYYMKLLGGVKWLKTIASVGTHFKNVSGNVTFMLANGYFKPDAYRQSAKAIYNDFLKKTDQELRDKMQEYIEAGIIDQSAVLGELRSMFKEEDFDKTFERRMNSEKLNSTNRFIDRVKRLGKKGAELAQNAYQAEDDYFKIVSYETEKNRYAKAMFRNDYSKLSEAEQSEVKDRVTEITKNVLPNYGRVPGAVKLVKAFPVVGTFISFQTEALRTAYNIVNLSVTELKSSNPEIKKIGALRMSGIIASQAIKYGVMYLIGGSMLGDDDDEKKESAKRFVAPWSKNSNVLITKEGDGKFSYIDFSASDPFGGIVKPLNAAMQGEDLLDGFIQGTKELVSPFTNPDILKSMFTEISENKDSYGNQLYNPSDTFEVKSSAILSRVYKTFEPGTATSIRKISKSDSPLNEMAGQFTGYKENDIDLAKQFSFKISDMKKMEVETRNIYNRAFRKFENKEITDAELEAAYNQSNKATIDTYKELKKDYDAAIFFGTDYKDLKEEMKRSKVSKDVIRGITTGDFKDLKKKEGIETDAELKARNPRVFAKIMAFRARRKKAQ